VNILFFSDRHTWPLSNQDAIIKLLAEVVINFASFIALYQGNFSYQTHESLPRFIQDARKQQCKFFYIYLTIKFRASNLKGQCHQIFIMNQFPHAVSNSQLKVHQTLSLANGKNL
jgi:hypothetical protein